MNADNQATSPSSHDKDLREARRLEAFERVMARMARSSKDRNASQN
jgi:hypothetical protein